MKLFRPTLPGPWSALLVAGACLLGAPPVAHGLEGVLPAKVKDLVSNGSWSENCAGSWTIFHILTEFNKNNTGCKIGIDSRLSIGKTLTDFKTENISILASAELLAKKLNANVYVVRDFMYIAPELPEGVTVTAGRTAAPVAAPPEPKKEDPPPGPPKVGGDKNGDKPPGSDKKTQKPPPNAGNKPPAANEKPLAPLRPITAGSGLAELPAIFPGVKPSTSSTIPWSHKSYKDAVAEGRPIMLFVSFWPSNPDIKKMTPEEAKIQTKLEKDQKDVANFLETLILEEPIVLQSLKGFNFIAIPWNEPADSWPPAFTEAAKAEGGALFLLPKDGSRPVLDWATRNPAYTSMELIKAARPLLGAPAVAAVKPPGKPDPAEVKKPDAPEKPKEDPTKPKKPKADGVQEE